MSGSLNPHLTSDLLLQNRIDKIKTLNIIYLPRQLEDVFSSDPSLTERMIIDTNRKHKK